MKNTMVVRRVRSPAFLKALMAGLAAPTMLYAPPAPYMAQIRDMSPAQSFAQVGALLTRTMRKARQDEEAA